MKIALLIESDGPGGAESVVLALADALREAGAEVIAVVLAGRGGWLSSRLMDAGHPVHMPTLARPIDPLFALNLARWARVHGIDVMHAHEFTMAFYSGIAGMLSGIPHVITMHGGTRYAEAFRRRVALRFSARRASALAGVSESTCSHLAEAVRIPRSQVEYIPNGIPGRTGDRDSSRGQLGLDSAERFILAVGNLYAVKGHDILIDAAALLLRETDLPPWRIGIAGRGDEETRLRRRIHDAALDERVHLLGLRDDIPDLLAAADCWVMPSRSEGLPMALLEAVFAKVAVIATAVGGIPSVIKQDQTGLLVPRENPQALAKAMADLLRNPEPGKIRAQTAYSEAYHQYGITAMRDAYLALYGRAISKIAGSGLKGG